MENVWFYFAGIPVYIYGVMISCGVFFGTILTLREGRRHNISWRIMFDFILGTGFTFFLASRLSVIWIEYGWGSVLRPWKIFTCISQGVNVEVGMIFALVFALLFTLRHQIFGLAFFDAITPGVLMVKLFGALGSNVFGNNTNMPWAVSFGELEVHPLPLYFALGYYVIFFLVWQVRRNQRFTGQAAFGALALGFWLQLILSFISNVNRYWILTLLFSFAWSYLFINSPPPKRGRSSLVISVSQGIIFLVVVLVLIIFFYSRFK